MNSKSRKSRRSYHHGNLRAALLDVARRLIVERGPHGFSLVEAASLAGVSPAAPYRHFANRDVLLAEVARSGYEQFADQLEAAWQEGKPDVVNAFLRMGEVYLSFARYERASYIAMFEAGLKGHEADKLKEAGDRAFSILIKAASALVAGLPKHITPSPREISTHIWAMSHGMATLFSTSGNCPEGDETNDMKHLFQNGMMVYLKGLGVDLSSTITKN